MLRKRRRPQRVNGLEVFEDVEKAYGDDEGIDKIDNSVKRKTAYRLFTYLKHGHMGKGNRIKIEDCVINSIRLYWPEEDGEYTGYFSN